MIKMQPKDEWTKQAERILASGTRPHFAPRKETFIVHQSLINTIRKQHRRPRALVLGATPELADFALEQQCIVYRVDNNPAMFAAAKVRESVAERSNETIIHSDWLNMDVLQNGQIDFVMGDASLNNVPIGQMTQVLSELKRVTHTGSIFSLKQIILTDEAMQHYSFVNALTSYREGSLTDEEFYLILRFHSFQHEAYDSTSYTLDAGIVFEVIRREHDKGRLTDDEYSIFAQRRGALKHTVYRKSEQIKLFRELLGDTDVVYPNDGCVYQDIFNMYSITRE
jgi:SAM-dependent methyltransferase